MVLFSLFGRLIVLSVFLPLSRPKENCPISETLQFIFVDSLEFFVQFFFDNWPLSNIQTGQKKDQEIEQKSNYPVFESGQFLLAKETDQLFGQFLIFLVGQKKIISSQRLVNSFIHSLDFFV